LGEYANKAPVRNISFTKRQRNICNPDATSGSGSGTVDVVCFDLTILDIETHRLVSSFYRKVRAYTFHDNERYFVEIIGIFGHTSQWDLIETDKRPV